MFKQFRKALVALCLGSLWGQAAVLAAADTPLPPGGVPLLSAEPLFALKLGSNAQSRAELKRVAAPGQPFREALRITTKARTADAFSIALSLDTSARLGPRETLFIRFWTRLAGGAPTNGDAQVRFRLNDNTPDRPPAFLHAPPVRVEAQWQRFDFPVPSRNGLPAGGGRFALGLGHAGPGAIEIGGLEVLSFGRVPPHELPFTTTTYEGRQPDAPWRQAAAERIERHRKASLAVHVTDAGGQPVPGAQVKVEMTRHAYAFGSEYNPEFILGTNADAARPREWMPKLFNRAVPGGSLKWPAWEQPRSRARFLESLAWLREHGVQVRGHVLLWPNWRYLPADVRALGEPLRKKPDAAAQAQLAKRVLDHVREETTALRGRITDWDVVNETFHNHVLMDVLGEPAMVDWYRAAREGAGPDVPLYLNENSVITGEKIDLFLRHAKLLLDGGAALGGLGEQGHGNVLPISTLATNLDRLAALGLPIQITEFDIVTPDEQLQADWTRDYLTLAFSHPATVGFLMWGFWDGAHWLGDAPLFYQDRTIKPSGRAWMDLVLKQWWTRAEGRTSTRGEYRIRAIHGDYEITVEHGGQRKVVKTSVGKEGKTVTVTW